MRIRRHKHNNRGFTLIELLAVIAIIALVMALIIGAASVARAKSMEGRAKADMQHIANGLSEYFLKNARYPADLNTPSSIPDVMQRLPPGVDLIDPWNQPYVYSTDATRSSFQLYSRGRRGNTADDLYLGR